MILPELDWRFVVTALVVGIIYGIFIYNILDNYNE